MKDRKFDYFRKFSDMAAKASQAADLLQTTLGAYDAAKLREATDAMTVSYTHLTLPTICSV